MKLKIFAIFDSKAEAYLPPFMMQATGLAIRTFQDMACDPKHQVGAHPEDYTLFEIGEYSQHDASIDMLEAKVPLGTGIEYKMLRQHEHEDMFSANAS